MVIVADVVMMAVIKLIVCLFTCLLKGLNTNFKRRVQRRGAKQTETEVKTRQLVSLQQQNESN